MSQDTVAAVQPRTRRRAGQPPIAAHPDPAPAPRKAAPVFMDPEKDFGQVIGELDGFPQARYTQDGRYFDIEGQLVPGAPVMEPDPRVEAKKRAKIKAAKEARRRYADRMQLVPGSIASRVGMGKAKRPEPAARVALRDIINAKKRELGMPVVEHDEDGDED